MLNIFGGCSGLKSLTLSENLTIIKANTFQRCLSLKDVVIPASVKYIYTNAFADCGLKEVTSLATTPPWAHESAFSNYDIPLYAPLESLSSYQFTSPWSKFSLLKAIEGGGTSIKKCALPTISYKNGQLSFECETEDVLFMSKITDNDINNYSIQKINLGITYSISVYATKSGYENSDVATATLCWIDVEPKTEGITNSVVDVRAKTVMIQNNGDILIISGAPEGSMISVYDLSGQMVGSAKASSTTTNISTSLCSGEICIVKIGEKSVKVVIR